MAKIDTKEKTHDEQKTKVIFINFFILFFLIFCLFRAAPTASGGSQARDQIGVVATSLLHNHSNTRFEPHLQPTP